MTNQSPIRALVPAWQSGVDTTTQVIGIGVDLVEVAQMCRLIEEGGQSFVDAVWTTREQRDADNRTESFAGKWAAKEAVMKALQHGIGEIDPKEIEIVVTSSGAPRVKLYGAARAIAKRDAVRTLHISVTHEGGWAAGFAIASSPSCSGHFEIDTTDNGRKKLD